jgi:hypothetical protein
MTRLSLPPTHLTHRRRQDVGIFKRITHETPVALMWRAAHSRGLKAWQAKAVSLSVRTDSVHSGKKVNHLWPIDAARWLSIPAQHAPPDKLNNVAKLRGRWSSGRGRYTN